MLKEKYDDYLSRLPITCGICRGVGFRIQSREVHQFRKNISATNAIVRSLEAFSYH
jgi:hypothetical protein